MLKVKGEKASADEEQAEKFVADVTNIVAMDCYLPENIYNADETGIFWRCLPDTTLALETEKQAFGAKLSKERITLLLCANASGTHEVDLLAIGKAKRPRGLPKYVRFHIHSSSGGVSREIRKISERTAAP